MRNGFGGGEDCRRFLIPPRNELKEKIGSLNIYGEVADLVNDEHPVLGKDFELVGQSVFKMGFLELFNELVIVDAIGRKPMLCSYQPRAAAR